MEKKFLYCLPLKSGAWVMAFINLTVAAIFIAKSSIEMSKERTHEHKVYLILGIIMGALNTFAGVILIMGVVKGKAELVLLYLLLELSNLISLTIFVFFNMLAYKSLVLGELFLGCIALWFGLISMVGYYTQMAECNPVKSGTMEITCNPHINPPMELPERAIESTAV